MEKQLIIRCTFSETGQSLSTLLEESFKNYIIYTLAMDKKDNIKYER